MSINTCVVCLRVAIYLYFSFSCFFLFVCLFLSIYLSVYRFNHLSIFFFVFSICLSISQEQNTKHGHKAICAGNICLYLDNMIMFFYVLCWKSYRLVKAYIHTSISVRINYIHVTQEFAFIYIDLIDARLFL